MARSEHRIAIATILRFFFQSEIYPYLVSIKACSYILNISLDDLIAVEEDEAPSFRASNDSAEARGTFEHDVSKAAPAVPHESAHLWRRCFHPFWGLADCPQNH